MPKAKRQEGQHLMRSTSTFCYGRPEDIGVVPIIIAELKFSNVQRHVLGADFKETRQDRRARAVLKSLEAEMKKLNEVYVVQRGDTLSHIALRITGDATRYPELIEINRQRLPKGPHKIFPGDELVIPRTWLEADNERD